MWRELARCLRPCQRGYRPRAGFTSRGEALTSACPWSVCNAMTPLALAICPVQALQWNDRVGAIEVNRELCISCRMCVAACPFGNMQDENPGWSRSATRAGDPRCVPFCPTKALDYVQADQAVVLPRGLRPWDIALTCLGVCLGQYQFLHRNNVFGFDAAELRL